MTWIRIGLLAAFLAGGPLAAIGAGHWMYNAARSQIASCMASAIVWAPSAPPLGRWTRSRLLRRGGRKR
jgi:hypothetical protein